MRELTLAGTDISVSNIALGLMRIRDMSDAQVRELVSVSLDHGVNFFDHADIYGGEKHACERRFGEALALSASERERMIIQTKAGIVPAGPYFDFSYDHLVSSANGSLAALGTDFIDIFLLHRPDALVEPAEVARAFDDLYTAGKVRAFGVSNHTPGQIELLRKYVKQPILVNQMQLSIAHAPMITQGIAANMQGEDQSTERDGGALDYCRRNDILIQAWSPMQTPGWAGTFLGNAKYPELNLVIDRLADEYAVTPEAIAVAWLTRHPANMQVILGTTTPARVAAAAAGSELPLTRAQWYELVRAAGYIVP